MKEDSIRARQAYRKAWFALQSARGASNTTAILRPSEWRVDADAIQKCVQTLGIAYREAKTLNALE